jgi:excisionase family DNA binding protein
MANTEWLTEDEAAEWLLVSRETLQEAIKTGQLPVLRLGSHIRINRDIVLKLASGSIPPVGVEAITVSDDTDNCIPVPLGMQWVEELVLIDPFEYKWPQKKEKPDDPGFLIVVYSPGWQGKISLQGREYTVRIGQGTGAMPSNEKKLDVFLNGVNLCVFSKTFDEQGWASIIKPDGKRNLGVDETPPALYRRTKIGSYRDVTGLAGSGVPHAAAVIIAKDDMRSVAHHAAARWLGRNHLPVEPKA